MKANIIWIFSLLLCLYGCGGGSDDPVVPEPTPTPTPTPEVVKPEIKLPSEITSSGIAFTENKAAEKSVSFTCNDDWTLSMKENRSVSWCTPSATSGKKGNVTITFTVTENTTYDNRSVTITIQCGTASTSFTISQEGKKALLLTQKEYEMEQAGGTIDIEVKANVDYEVLIPADVKWIEQTSHGRALSKSQVSFTVNKNESTQNRSVQIVFINKTAQVSDTLSITQKGAPETTIGTGNNITDWNNGNSNSGSASEQ